MAENDLGDKTEEPTQRRREEAREEGQVARSVELTAAASLLAALLLLRGLGPSMVQGFGKLVRRLCGTADVSIDATLADAERTAIAAAELALPFLLGILALTIVVAAAQSGLSLTWKKLSLRLDQISPVAGAKRLFSADALSRLAIGLTKVTIVVIVAWHTIAAKIDRILAAGVAPSGGLWVLAAGMVFDLAIRLGLVLLVLGIIDYLVSRWRLERQLRMTKQEVRDELKRMEGDPLIKQRRRQLQQRLAMQRIRTEVPKADVVVTNPTEFAVALKYDEATMAAPRVVAKGVDLLAQRIRQVAQEHGVPVVQRPPLARALYATVDVGKEVPSDFYRAVAEVLAYVYQLSRRAG